MWLSLTNSITGIFLALRLVSYHLLASPSQLLPTLPQGADPLWTTSPRIPCNGFQLGWANERHLEEVRGWAERWGISPLFHSSVGIALLSVFFWGLSWLRLPPGSPYWVLSVFSGTQSHYSFYSLSPKPWGDNDFPHCWSLGASPSLWVPAHTSVIVSEPSGGEFCFLLCPYWRNSPSVLISELDSLTFKII